MNEKSQPTNDQILYAQALQIAIQLSGDTQNVNTAFPNDIFVEKHLEKYRELARSVIKVLRRQ
jgi:hypothetical protein